MSRAFVTEDTGWKVCTKWYERCFYANGDGTCWAEKCSEHPEAQGAEASTECESE